MGNQLGYPDINLSGKVALVTGGNTGIGYETAKGLAGLGAHTLIACRSKERAEKAIKSMKCDIAQMVNERTGESKGNNEGSSPHSLVHATTVRGEEVKIDYLPLDLASFRSTKECVRMFKERNLPLHVLVNNAGIAMTPFAVTEDYLETQLQVNHLGPMLLTLELLPLLLDSAASCGDSRIIFLTSDGHYHASSFNPDTLGKADVDNYKRMEAYFNSKLYNVMTAYNLQKKLQNKFITVSSVHPGFVNSEIARGVQDWTVSVFFYNIVSNVFGRSTAKGAMTSLNCAVNPELNSQQHFYYDSCKVKEPSADSKNELFQQQLWEASMDLLKDHLSPEICTEYGPESWKTAKQKTSNGTDPPLGELANAGWQEDMQSQKQALNGSAILSGDGMEERPNEASAEFQSKDLGGNVTFETQEEQARALQSEEPSSQVSESDSIPVNQSVAMEDKEEKRLLSGCQSEEEKEDSQSSPEKNDLN